MRTVSVFPAILRRNALVAGVAFTVAALPGCQVIEMLGLGGWDGSKPYSCGGSMTRTLENLKIDYVPGSGPLADTAITAGGSCKLTLINCQIRGDKVIGAGGNARVVIKGGRIEGREKALDVGGHATIEVTGGAEILGPVRIGSDAKITGMPEQEKKQAKRSLSNRFGKGACSAVVRCYQQHKAFGNVQGLVSGEVNARGKVTAAKYSSGKAPKAVRRCLVKAMKSRSIAGFDGNPGRLQCQYAGILTAGGQMLSLNPQFVRSK